MSAEPTSSRLIGVRLAAAAGAAAKPTQSGSTLRNPAAVACAAAEPRKPAASRTICIDVATCRTIQYPKSLGASATTNYTGGRGGECRSCRSLLSDVKPCSALPLVLYLNISALVLNSVRISHALVVFSLIVCT